MAINAEYIIEMILTLIRLKFTFKNIKGINISIFLFDDILCKLK